MVDRKRSGRARRWIGGGLLGGLLLGGATAGYAYAIEPRRLQVARFCLAVPGLPPELEGLRLAHLTDFHVGMAGTRRSTLRRAVAAALADRPDLVALTGDFTHDGRWRRGATLFTDLAAAAPTFAVLGNHDHLASRGATDRIVGALTAQGVRVLANEHFAVPVRDGAGEVLVVGVDDPHLGFDDLPDALAGADDRPSVPAILLGHVPDIVEKAPPGRFALTLAGHTHGGQIRLSPLKRFTWLELPMIAGDLDSHYPRGAHLVNGNPLYVSNGLGVSGVPFRFLAPPQIALFAFTGAVDEEKGEDEVGRYVTGA